MANFRIDTVYSDKTKRKNNVDYSSDIDYSEYGSAISSPSLEANNKTNQPLVTPVSNIASNKGLGEIGYKSVKSKNKYGRLSKDRPASKVNPDEIKSYLNTKGFSKTATAGILANIHGESGFNSNVVGDNGMAYGLFQHNSSRRDALLDYMNDNRMEHNNYKGQIDFAISEMKPEFIRKMNNTKSPEEAAEIFTREFERPANVNKDAANRAAMSRGYFKYGGSIPQMNMGGYTIDGGSFGSFEKPDVGGAALSGAAKGFSAGATIGSIIPGVGTAVVGAIGAVVGGVAGWIGGNKKKKQYEEAMRKRNVQMNKYMENQSQSILSMYSPQGQAGQYGYYKYGGSIPKYALGTKIDNPQYEAEKGEVVEGTNAILEDSEQLASNLQLVGGNKHEEGGTLGTGGERVYSDRLTIDVELLSLLKKSGIKIKDKNPTFAKVAIELAKLKGKFEEKVNSDDYISKNTGNVMLGKTNNLLDLTFAVQEAKKESEGIENPVLESEIPQEEIQPMFAYGGSLPKLANGFRNSNYLYGNGSQSGNAVNSFALNGSVSDGMGAMNNFNSYAGIALSTAGLINSLVQNGKMNTKVPVLQQNAPHYLYNDRSGLQRSENRAAYRNFINNPVNQKGISNQYAFAQMIKQDNNIAQNENQRRDQYNMNFQGQSRANDSQNLERMRMANLQTMQLENQKSGQKGSIINSYVQNMNNVVRESEERRKWDSWMDLQNKALQARLGYDPNQTAPQVISAINKLDNQQRPILQQEMKTGIGTSRNEILKKPTPLHTNPIFANRSNLNNRADYYNDYSGNNNVYPIVPYRW